MRIFFSIVIFIFTFSINLYSHINSIKFKHLSVVNGLSQSWVRSICQDNQGFIWIGTYDGLNRYDGYNFKVYKHSLTSKNTISNNTILVIYKDHEGYIWIGTSYGLNLYNNEKDDFITFPEIGNDYINDLARDKDGILYIATNQGFKVFNPKTKETKNYQILEEINFSKSIAIIYKIKIDRNNNIWIASTKGIYWYNKKDQKLEALPCKFKYNARSIEFDRMNRLWIGTQNIGLLIYSYDLNNPDKGSIQQIKHNSNNSKSLSDGAIISLLADKNDLLWIGIENGGLDILNLINFHPSYPDFIHIKYDALNNASISSNSIYTIYEDINGSIWVGTYTNGLNIYYKYGSNFNYISHIKYIPDSDKGLSGNIVNVIQKKDEQLWIGTEGGLDIYNIKTQKFTHFSHQPKVNNSLSANSVWAIHFDENEKVWIGTWAGGLDLLNIKNNNFIHYNYNQQDANSIGADNIFYILEDSFSNFWIATMGGGLNLFNKKTNTFKKYVHDVNDNNTIASNWVRAIFESSYGELWVSNTLSVDIFDRKNEKFIHFYHISDDSTSISHNGAQYIFEDSKRTIWLGTENGLNYFNRNDSTFVYYLEKDGLPNNSIKAILEDDNGNLWLSTNKGISKFNHGINLPKKPVFKNFDISDGLQDNEFSRRCAYKDENGMMYFGGINGLNYFHPDSLKINPFIPEVVITSFSINNKLVQVDGADQILSKNISNSDRIVIPHKYSVISFEYVALNYIAPEKNQFAYFLEGFEETWNYVGNQRTITYTNLNQGDYTLRVKASNNDNVWNNIGTSLKITILPPWYKSWWAYSLYVILILITLYLFRRFILIKAKYKHDIKMEQLEKQKLTEMSDMKSRFFTNISHEFRTPLTLILQPLEQLLSKTRINPDLKKQYQMIQGNAKRLLKLINQLLDLSKIESDYLNLEVAKGDFVEKIKTIIAAFNYKAEQKSISLKFKSSHEKYMGYFDGDKLEKIVYNLLSNAFKYTLEMGNVWVIMNIHDNDKNSGYFSLKIKDDGVGIEEKNIHKIFSRFYQVNNKEIKDHSGTGIGLSLVKGLVNIYHGEIEVTSELNKGTEFNIKLPYDKNYFSSNEIIDSKPMVNSSESSDNFYIEVDNKTIDINKNIESIKENYIKEILLIVEDNIELNKILYSHFKKSYSVFCCYNGNEGLIKAKEIIPDLIISDIIMPEMDGIEMCKILKIDELTSHIPIILLTSLAEEENKIKGTEIGSDAYIPKPFNLQFLNAKVKNLIESRKKLRKIFSNTIHIKPQEISITSVDEKFLKKAIALVEKNISNSEFNVDLFSKEIGLSRAHLHRKLISLTDQPPSGFIRIMRLKRAAQLMVDGQLNVSEVLYEVGIKSRSYFVKSFKESFGLTPKEYAEKNKSLN